MRNPPLAVNVNVKYHKTEQVGLSNEPERRGVVGNAHPYRNIVAVWKTITRQQEGTIVTGRERIRATFTRSNRDHLACMPITMMFAADCLGVKYGDYQRDYRLLADAQIKTADKFGFDHVSAIAGTCEAEDCGAKMEWYEDQPVSVVEAESRLLDKSALAGLRAPRPAGGRRMRGRLLAVDRLRQRVGAEKLVEGWVEGPCAAAADLRGISRLMLDFADDPAFVTDLFEVVLELAIAFAQAQLEAGADLIGVGDAAASLVGPRIYSQFVLPFEKRLVNAIHQAGGMVRLHICGNTRRILPGIAELGCEMLDLDYPVPMPEARKQLGPGQVIAGNLDPVKELRDGTPETVRQRLTECMNNAGPNYIVAAGCEIVRTTAHENVYALSEFARTMGTMAAVT